MRPTLLALALVLAAACDGGVASGPADIDDKASVAVTNGTRVTRRAANGEVSATFRDLVPGLRVEVWFDGPVATSYPVQGKARAVVIVR